MFKVIRNNGKVVAFGPDDDNYDPVLKNGDELTIEETSPSLDELPAIVSGKIDALEKDSQMNRFVREAMLRISEKEAQALGITQQQLYQANLGYKRIKDLDTQIAQLRGKL